MNTNRIELSMDEIETVIGGGFWNHVVGAGTGMGIGALAGSIIGSAIGPAGTEIGLAAGAVAGAVAGGVWGIEKIADKADSVMQKIVNLF